MPRPRKNWTGTRNEHGVEIVGRAEPVRDKHNKRIDYFTCRCPANGTECKGLFDIAASNFPNSRSCGCIRRRSKPNPTLKANSSASISDFSEEFKAEVRRVRNVGERTERADFDGYWTGKRLRYEDVAKECKISYEQAVAICSPMERCQQRLRETKRRAEDARWLMALQSENQRPLDDCPDMAQSNAKRLATVQKAVSVLSPLDRHEVKEETAEERFSAGDELRLHSPGRPQTVLLEWCNRAIRTTQDLTLNRRVMKSGHTAGGFLCFFHLEFGLDVQNVAKHCLSRLELAHFNSYYMGPMNDPEDVPKGLRDLDTEMRVALGLELERLGMLSWDEYRTPISLHRRDSKGPVAPEAPKRTVAASLVDQLERRAAHRGEDTATYAQRYRAVRDASKGATAYDELDLRQQQGTEMPEEEWREKKVAGLGKVLAFPTAPTTTREAVAA